MIKHYKLFSILIIVGWAMLAWSIVAIELIHLDSTLWVGVGVASGLLLILLHGGFIYVYSKSKKKILGLQEQYIETLKPDAPLRFCPSDEELVMAYRNKEEAMSSEPETIESKIEESVNQNDEPEMI